MSESEEKNTERTAAQKKMEARLKELDARMQLLSAQAERLQADAQVEGMQTMQRLREQRDAVAGELENFRNATGAALERIGSGVRNAVDDLSRAIDDAAKTFSEKEPGDTSDHS